jgi:hypothetical protein
VHDATQSSDAAQRGDDLVDRAARVQDQRQLEFAREFELAHELQSLHGGIEAFDEEVEAAFAERDRALAQEPVTQRTEVLGPMLGEEHRVQAPGRMQSFVRRA